MSKVDPNVLFRVSRIAGEIGRDIVEFAFLTILKERMEKEKRQEVNEQDWNIVVEFIAFLLHITNRFAFTSIPSNRNLFMDACGMRAWTYLMERMIHPDTVESRWKEIEEQLLKLSNDREIEYGKYRVATPENQPLKGDLFWKFGKRIAKMHGHENSFLAITEASMKAMMIVESLKLNERLKAANL